MSKVIPFQLNASNLYHKAVQAADKYKYDKALFFFKRAVEIEPENPVHHCNVAGLLSEMGKFEESNQILQHILKDIAPNLMDCYYFMANNYAYLEEFDEAEACALKYLKHEPNGMYVEDTVELLEQLSEELGHSLPPLSDFTEQEKVEANDRARILLEQGKMSAAEQVLKQSIRSYPDFLPARNNLSLTYYYTGKMDKAIAEANRVLELDENNLHAICNLAIFYKHMGEIGKLTPLFEGLRKLYPMHSELVYKLATTLGLLGDHEQAYRLFFALYKDHGVQTPSLIHQLAVASYNCCNWKEAGYWWKKLNRFEEAKEISASFLKLLDSTSERGQVLGYRYPNEQASLSDSETYDDLIDEEGLAIVEGILITMRKFWPKEYNEYWHEAESRLWMICNMPGRELKKRKWNAIAASIEYGVMSKVAPIVKKEIAERYQISMPTLNKYIDLFL